MASLLPAQEEVQFCSLKKNLAPEINDILLSATPGDVVSLNGFDLAGVEPLEYLRTVLPGPKHIISDDPEYIRVPEGLALQEPLEPGAYRLYVYNVNGVKEPEKMPRKISVVVENLGEETMTLKFSHKAFWKPSNDYQKVAQETLYQYMIQEEEPLVVEDLIIPAGGAAPLDMKMENAVVLYDDLVHCLHEFTVNQPGRISVVQTAPDVPSIEALKKLDSVLESPRANAGRGTFDVSEYSIIPDDGYIPDSKFGPFQLIVADGKTDPWVRGIDNSSGQELVLAGNYGVMYDISIPWTSSDGRGLAVCAWNPAFGPPWCFGTAMAVQINEGVYAGGTIKLPKDAARFNEVPEVVLLQAYLPPEKGEVGKIEFTYSPPGAACIPIPFLFVPISFSDQPAPTSDQPVTTEE